MRGQDTAVMGAMLKLPLPFCELVLMMYITLQGSYWPYITFQTMKALDVSSELLLPNLLFFFLMKFKHLWCFTKLM